jgi:hypothetical protein
MEMVKFGGKSETNKCKLQQRRMSDPYLPLREKTDSGVPAVAADCGGEVKGPWWRLVAEEKPGAHDGQLRRRIRGARGGGQA